MPADIPVTKPVVALIVAIAVLLLLHVPPVVESNKVVVEPTHKLVVPIIADIDVPPVTVKYTRTQQPVLSV